MFIVRLSNLLFFVCFDAGCTHSDHDKKILKEVNEDGIDIMQIQPNKYTKTVMWLKCGYAKIRQVLRCMLLISIYMRIMKGQKFRLVY